MFPKTCTNQHWLCKLCKLSSMMQESFPPIMDNKWVAPILLVPKKTGTILEEIQNDTYENARIYKEKTKSLHDRMITRKEFHVGDKILLYNSCLKLFPGNLHSRWIGPFVVSNIFPYGAVKITSLETNKVLKVLGIA